MRARGLRPAFSPASFVPIKNRGGAIHDARGIAGHVHVVDALDLGIFLERDTIEAEILAHVGK